MSDAQLDTIIEKLDQIIEHLMLGGVTEKPVTVTSTFEVPFGIAEMNDEVSRWALPGDHLALEVTKRDGAVIDVQILPI